MFAIAFDLVVADTRENHPISVSAAYSDIGSTLEKFEFTRVHGSLYVCEKEDMVNLFAALMALKTLIWLPASVRDIRAFKVEQWSDFTSLIKG